MLLRIVNLFIFFFVVVNVVSSEEKLISSRVMTRFYRNFGNVYRQAEEILTSKDPELVHYRFIFPSVIYKNISEESITMSSTEVVRRTIKFYRNPSINDVGSNSLYEFYFPNRTSKMISCVSQRWNPFERFSVFSKREIRCRSISPIEDFYEVLFECRNSAEKKNSSFPALSYNDRTLRWSARYSVELSQISSETNSFLIGFADLRNDGPSSILLDSAELVSGDVSIDETFSTQRTINYRISSISDSTEDQNSGIYVYPLTIENQLEIPAFSLESVRFLTAKINVQPFLIYSSSFSSSNSFGKLQRVYNFSTIDVNLPEGRLTIREDDRFIAQIQIPQLAQGEILPLKIGMDSDVLYQRTAQIVNTTENSSSTTYQIEYSFENRKQTKHVRVHFTENFSNFQHFLLQSTSNENIQLVGNEIRTTFSIPSNSKSIQFHYRVTIFKTRQPNNY